MEASPRLRRLTVTIVTTLALTIAIPAGGAMAVSDGGEPATSAGKKKVKRCYKKVKRNGKTVRQRVKCKKPRRCYKKVKRNGKIVKKRVKCKKKSGTQQQTPGTTPTPGSSPTPTTGGTTEPKADPRTRFLKMINDSGWYRAKKANTPQGEISEDRNTFCADGRYFNRFISGFSGTEYVSSGSWQIVGDVRQGNVGGYDLVEASVVANATDQYGEAKQYDMVISLTEQRPDVAVFNGDTENLYNRVAPQGC